VQLKRILRQIAFDLVFPLIDARAQTYVRQWMRARVFVRRWTVVQYPGRPLIIGA